MTSSNTTRGSCVKGGKQNPQSVLLVKEHMFQTERDPGMVEKNKGME